MRKRFGRPYHGYPLGELTATESGATPSRGDPAAAPLRSRLGVLAGVAVAAGAAGAAAMMATLMAIAEISSDPTSVSGIDSSAWTPPTSIASFLFGPDAFASSFRPLPILFGLVVHLGFSILFGALGLALVVWMLGYRPGPLAAAVFGLGYGLALEILFLNLLVNGVQGDNTVYESLPPWGWWAAHAAYGVALFLVAAALLRGARLLGGQERAPAATAAVSTP